MTDATSWDSLFDNWKRKIDNLVNEHPLQIISWEATRRCNLKCIHCGSPSEIANHKEELTTEEIVEAFDQIARGFDMRQFRHINITGGEPFVRKDILEVLQHIHKWPFYRNIDIQTNGIVLADHPELFEELKQYGVTGLGISIDGLEETHDSFRRLEGSFRKAYCAAQLAVESGYVVTVSVVAHSKNIDEIPALFQRVKHDIRPRVFRIMTIDPLGRAEQETEYMLSSQQIIQVISFLKDEYQKNCHTYSNSTTTMVELGCGGWMGKDLEGMFRPMIFHCIAGLNNLGILYDGKLGSCSNISREFIEGDLRKERIRDVWENRYQRYREFDWKKTGECTECDQWEYCHGGPMHKRRVVGTATQCLMNQLHDMSSTNCHCRITNG